MPGIAFRRPSKVRKTRLARQTSRRERATSLFRLCRRFGARRRNADRTAGIHRLLEHRQCTLRGVRQEDATRQRRMQVGLDLDHVIDEHGVVSFAGKSHEVGCSPDSIQPSGTIESTVDQLSRLPALETPVDHPRPALCRVLLAWRAWRPMHAPSRFDADMKRRRGNDSMKTGTMSPLPRPVVGVRTALSRRASRHWLTRRRRRPCGRRTAASRQDRRGCAEA